MINVSIIAAKRSALGKANRGKLAQTRPDTFGSLLLNEIISKFDIKVNDIEDIVLGCAMPEGQQGMNVARIVSQLSGIPNTSAGLTVNRFCASGLQSISTIASSIKLGEINLGIAGGVESMSFVPMGGFNFKANPLLLNSNSNIYISMGLTAELVAQKYNISREEQDNFSFLSHQKACNAIKSGTMSEEIEPIKIIKDKKEIIFDTDEGPRSDTSFERLQKLSPVFKKDGTVTAGNSSQVSDGAAFVAMCSDTYAKENNLKALGYFRNFVSVGVDPEIMGIGPIFAIRKLLKKTGLNLDDIGLFEINEAFASQAVHCIKTLGISSDIVNVNGGAIALGHPLGCTGSRQVVTLLHEMIRRNIKFGVVSMCVGGGMGCAALIENTSI